MNTRNMCGGLAYVMAILFFLAASPAVQCRPHELASVGSHAYGLTDTISKLGVDESKVAVVFCAKVQCEPKRLCYCCMTEKPEPLCYDTLAECRAVCPTCDPKCPP
ncbi:unnamed protein product [Urochloa decumbens]|uniref:Bowman-Birk serine protease inhibitors family domain-containing protein n=1 Tax=Urochloa decumbens TaxID=240449 RepID=A0ABC8Y7Y4_9POAL